MARCKVPNFITGRKGRGWTQSLKNAAERGAVILVEDVGVTVHYLPLPGSKAPFRPWIDSRGHRYDSVECIPVW